MRESAWSEVPEVTNEISGYMIEQEQQSFCSYQSLWPISCSREKVLCTPI
jgi:hypothetical protein